MYKIAQTLMWVFILICTVSFTAAHWADMEVTGRLVCLGFSVTILALVYASVVETDDTEI